MSTLFSAMQAQPTATTANGMPTLVTSGNDLLDLFGIIGNRGFNLQENLPKIKQLVNSDPVMLGRLFLWSRDCRGGAGHRDPVRQLIVQFAESKPEFVKALSLRLPELGYWKDLIWIFDRTKSEDLKQHIVDMFIVELANAVKERRFSLLAKYLPRKGELAVAFRNAMKFTPKSYRRMIVQLSKTVEQQMCAKDWDEIDFEKVPSIALMRYRKAFERHTTNWEKFQTKVEKGEAKINSAQLNPGEIVSKCFGRLSDTDEKYLTNAWNALPDYLNGINENWLPVIDVSGSMTTHAGNSSMTCMDISVGLGLYLAERNKGLFNNQFITFSDTPMVENLQGKKFNSIADKIEYIKRADWGYSTNLESVFDLILKSAVNNKISESEMPTKLVILSDMEFNKAVNKSDRALKMIEQKYQEAGYKLPQVVFWNISSRTKNMTVNINDSGTCQISGYSPAIFANLTNLDKFTPLSVMYEVIGKDRYDF